MKLQMMLVQLQPRPPIRTNRSLHMGGGSSGPSPEEIAQEDSAAAERAQSESNEATEQAALEKQRAAEAATADAVNQANASSLLAQKNQMLLAGVAGDQKNNQPVNPLENPAITGNILTNNGQPTGAAKPSKGSAPSGVGG